MLKPMDKVQEIHVYDSKLPIYVQTNIYNEARKNLSVKNVKKPISYSDAQKFVIFYVNVTKQIKYTFQPFNSDP